MLAGLLGHKTRMVWPKGRGGASGFFVSPRPKASKFSGSAFGRAGLFPPGCGGGALPNNHALESAIPLATFPGPATRCWLARLERMPRRIGRGGAHPPPARRPTRPGLHGDMLCKKWAPAFSLRWLIL